MVIDQPSLSCISLYLPCPSLNAVLIVYCPNVSCLNLSGQQYVSPSMLLTSLRRLPYLTRLDVVDHPHLDGSWLLEVIRQPISHGLTIHISLTHTIIRTIRMFLHAIRKEDGSINIMRDDTTNADLLLPSTNLLTSSTSNGAILRMRLSERIQQQMTYLSKGRITLLVQA